MSGILQQHEFYNISSSMKKTYHICMSAGDEVLCRSEEDYIYCFNSLALAIHDTGSSLLADSIMSTHLHECVRTEDPLLLVRKHRYTYTRYFNRKYHRKGSLVEPDVFIIELDGLYHTLAAMNYTFRNALHHGVSPTPLAYRHSSARVIFRKALGHAEEPQLLHPSRQHRFLPYRTKCPEGYRMDKSGLILREDVVDTVDVEHMFVTPRSYLYNMNRLSGEEWMREQEKDGNGDKPVTLDMIEEGARHQTISEMLSNEHGRNDYNAISDIGLCTHIDKVLLPQMGRESVYVLSMSEKTALARHLKATYRLPSGQIRRCLAM